MLCHSEIYIATPKKNDIPLKLYTLTHSVPILRHMLCHSEICFCHSEICIATLKKKNTIPPEILHRATHPQRTYPPTYALPLRNMLCHSEICIATPKNTAIPLKFNILTHSVPILRHMLCHSEICFATPKYALLPRQKTAIYPEIVHIHPQRTNRAQ